MSVESHHRDQSRPLRDDEKALLITLLSNRADYHFFEPQITDGKVNDMPDGGMGSVKFVTVDGRSFGEVLVEAEYLDVDGVLVSIAINSDDRRELYEVDFWKVDFSSLKQYPRPELVKIKSAKSKEINRVRHD